MATLLDRERHSEGTSKESVSLKSCSRKLKFFARISHEGPVWQVAWAHPKFGPILASASYDGKVIIWKDNGSGSGTSGSTNTYGAYGSTGAGAGGWTKIKEHGMHSASGECSSKDRMFFFPLLYVLVVLMRHTLFPVNSIAWAPHELGSILACASSDGNISVLTFNSEYICK